MYLISFNSTLLAYARRAMLPRPPLSDELGLILLLFGLPRAKENEEA